MSANLPSGTTILCIDDDRDILKLLEKFLAGAGYTVITAIDGKQGLSEALTRKPDLILLDIVMPGMNGYEICKKKDKEETKNIPIIFITAKKEDEDEAKGLKIGAVDYIRKPFYPPP